MTYPKGNIREKFWADVWVAVASDPQTVEKAIPTGWADSALEEFDKRFPQMQTFKISETTGTNPEVKTYDICPF